MAKACHPGSPACGLVPCCKACCSRMQRYSCKSNRRSVRKSRACSWTMARRRPCIFCLSAFGLGVYEVSVASESSVFQVLSFPFRNWVFFSTLQALTVSCSFHLFDSVLTSFLLFRGLRREGGGGGMITLILLVCRIFFVSVIFNLEHSLGELARDKHAATALFG